MWQSDEFQMAAAALGQAVGTEPPQGGKYSTFAELKDIYQVGIGVLLQRTCKTVNALNWHHAACCLLLTAYC